jgi:pilus assembly protein CpaC
MYCKNRTILGVLALTVAVGWAVPMIDTADAQDRSRAQGARTSAAPTGAPKQLLAPHDTPVMVIPARSQFPLSRKASMGMGKSLMIQFPVELRDVMVADPEKVDAVVQSSDRVFLISKKAGTTNAFFFDGQGNQILSLEISVGSDLSVLDDLLARVIPGSRIKTEVAGSLVVLTGTVRSSGDLVKASDIAAQFATKEKDLASGSTTGQGDQADTAEKDKKRQVVNLLGVEGEDQVMLKVTIAEVQRSVLKQFGINVGAELMNGNMLTSILTQNGNPLTAAAGLTPIGNTARNNAANRGQACSIVLPQLEGSPDGFVGNSGPSGIYRTATACLSYTMRALERHGLAHTLAEPNITAVNGESARFLAGGEYPIPVSQQNGAISIEYRPFGVGLTFTPTVLSEGRISLKIDSEVSELSNEGAVQLANFQIPALRKRAARSVLELPSGGSMVMAGLISTQTRQNIDGFPGLKDVPLLGTLFRSRDFVKGETELVIIVTPYLVKATARQNLARPDDGFAPASDMKANFLGHLNRVYGRGTEAPTSGGLKGDYGFIVE